jgi:hypothetical protein
MIYKGFLAPDFELPTSSGETITLSDINGQAVLINLWATWCRLGLAAFGMEETQWMVKYSVDSPSQFS